MLKTLLPVFALSLLLTNASQAEQTRDTRPCSAAKHDGNIFADGLGHNSFDASYRSPFGAVPTNQGSIALRFRTCRNDADSVRIRVWNTAERREIWIPMTRESDAVQDPTLGPIEFWKATVEVPSHPTLLYYFFEIRDGSHVNYYNSDNSPLARGGWGRFSVAWDDLNTYPITVYDQSFHVPDWFKGAVMYHILPDRFRNGDPTNDPANGTGFVFGKTIRKLSWNEPLCDPRGSVCPGESDNQFYGGDLEGVIQKLDYLKSLGVNVLYFNPIFLSATNHRYDTQDYMKIDPKLGDLNTFKKLVAEARSRDMKIILDGVFNHGSADSPYFDLFNRWGGTGACDSVDSPYRDWFYFPHFAMRPIDHARPGVYYYCKGQDGTPITYESWWGYYEHPVYRKNAPAIRDYFFAKGTDSVAPWWIRNGSSGWRLDVAGDVAPGEGADPTNDFWQGFRKAIKAENPDAVMIGEEWANAANWLLGHEWDSATNYRFRTLLLDWLADGCTGAGCSNDVFQDDNNNWESPNGPIAPLSETEFVRRLTAIQQDYPNEAFAAMMNPLGSHDTQRALFVLKKVSRDSEATAYKKIKLGALFQFTYPGVPVIFYGDEAGVAAEGKWYDGRWKGDPYSRAVYPWADQGLHPDQDLITHFSTLGKLRNEYAALKSGSFELISADDARHVLTYRRVLNGTDSANQVWIVLNRSAAAQRITIPASLSDGTAFTDVLNGGTFKTARHFLDVGEVPAYFGRVLVLKSR